VTDRIAIDHLATEGRLPAARDLDLLRTSEQVALFAAEDARAVAAVAAAGDQIAAAVDLTVERLRRGGRLIYVGAGTPGRLAVTDAAECRPTFGLPDGRVVAVMAGGDHAMSRAAERGEDDAAAGHADLDALAPTGDDVVVGISASGRTPYVLAALQRAAEAGAATVALVNNTGSPIAGAADVAIVAETGPEIVSGSTRLKAGTAQKLVLNTLSTLTMVQLGHTYGDLMVDVQATNDKLVARAHAIVAAATGATGDHVEAALAAADGAAKVAIVTLLADVDAAEARRRLDAADGHVRAAVGDGAA
jgi:N-acetylmuramic acid 6-phosphate etherase